MGTNRDNGAAKERLVDSLGNARDVTVTSVREDIAPAVAAAVEAAIDASAPLYAEAASRAGDAVTALRASDTVNSVLNNEKVQLLVTSKSESRRRRWPFLLVGVGAGAAAFTIVKRRNSRDALIDLTEVPPASYDDATDPSAADLGPDSA